MKRILTLFSIGFRQVLRDGMLLLLLPTPLLFGSLVKWGMPAADVFAWEGFGFRLAPWYGVADSFLLAFAPVFPGIISAFLLLDEREEGIGSYYRITPAAGGAYLSARLLLPMLWAFLCNLFLGAFFCLTAPTAAQIILVSLLGAGGGLSIALMIAALSNGRVEGLALMKLAGASVMSVFAAWLIPSSYRYLAAIFPGFWVGELMREPDAVAFWIGLCVCALWSLAFAKRFLRGMN